MDHQLHYFFGFCLARTAPKSPVLEAMMINGLPPQLENTTIVVCSVGSKVFSAYNINSLRFLLLIMIVLKMISKFMCQVVGAAANSRKNEL